MRPDMRTEGWITDETRRDLADKYLKMDPEQIKADLQKKDTLTLYWWLDDIALRIEAYELCAVIRDVLKERGEE